MKDTLSNKLSSFKNSLGVADKDEFKAIWSNNAPLAFTTGLESVRTEVQQLSSAGAEQSVPTTGNTEALRNLRKNFEARLHVLARGSFRALKKLGRTEDAAKVDLTPSALHNARANALAGLGETVLELAEPLTVAPRAGQPAPGADYISADLVTEVDDLWEQFSVAVGATGGARARRKAQTGALPGRFAAVEEHFAELDDLIVQFRAAGALGEQFVEAWFNARRVAELGRRAAKAPATAQGSNGAAAQTGQPPSA